jgi:hypothetical protein
MDCILILIAVPEFHARADLYSTGQDTFTCYQGHKVHAVNQEHNQLNFLFTVHYGNRKHLSTNNCSLIVQLLVDKCFQEHNVSIVGDTL